MSVEEASKLMRRPFSLSDRGRTFATRPRGAELRQELVAATIEGDRVELDLAGVLSVSYSFADEFIAAFVEEAHARSVTLSIQGASPEVSRVVERALARRGVLGDVALVDSPLAVDR
jgi:hypothetical protein